MVEGGAESVTVKASMRLGFSVWGFLISLSPL